MYYWDMTVLWCFLDRFSKFENENESYENWKENKICNRSESSPLKRGMAHKRSEFDSTDFDLWLEILLGKKKWEEVRGRQEGEEEEKKEISLRDRFRSLASSQPFSLIVAMNDLTLPSSTPSQLDLSNAWDSRFNWKIEIKKFLKNL